MALNNNAKVSDIITSLQDMQGINQKYELQSALNNKGIDATEDDSMAEMILKLNDTPMRKWASGVFKAIADTNDKITITGLTFIPGIIIAEQTQGSQLRKVYFKDTLIPTLNSRSYYGSDSYNTGPWTVSSNGFSTNMNPFSGIGTTVSWIAFE